MKWIVHLAEFVLTVVLIAGASIFFLPADRITSLAADQTRTAIGRDVSIPGDVSMTLWPTLGVFRGPTALCFAWSQSV